LTSKRLVAGVASSPSCRSLATIASARVHKPPLLPQVNPRIYDDSHGVEFREWVGHRELGRLLAQSSMAILPSREENFALAALAAMAVGTPLITTNVEGVAELVEHGESGVLCSAGDATALSDAVLQLRTRPEWAGALGARAHGRVRDNFTWDVAVRKFESLYGQLV
jgi:glycosyltransferase involved in cell wall biosynthesis